LLQSSDSTFSSLTVGDIDVFIATEQRFMLSNGHFYAEAVSGEGFWQRYLEVFRSAKIVARVQPVASLPENAVRVDGRGITVLSLPDYLGSGALTAIPSLLFHTRKAAYSCGAFILRLPGLIGTLTSFWLRARRWPYAVEVVGDPYDSLSSQALGKMWADWVRIPFVFQLRKQCQDAVACAYVTRETLQKRYPPGAGYTTYYSSIELDSCLVQPAARAHQQRSYERRTGEHFRLIFVGSLSQRYKGLHVLLEAVRICQSQGLPLELVILGDGHYRSEYEKLADSLATQNVNFRGYLRHGQNIYRELSEADLFIMPSFVEGLPRAMIEAMACGLPCVASRIGGIPELLSDEDMVLPGDALALANKITEVLTDPARLRTMSERNYRASLEYSSENLRERRNAFYRFVHDTTIRRVES
jgi:glycosyltransferase involved in cell wall biosynthesis